MLRAALVGGLLLLVGMASAQDVGPIKTENDVQYGQVGDVKLHLDIARPEKLDKPAPCIVIIHGGGWRGGNRMAHRPQIVEFAKRGYVSATIGYRLIPHRFPAAVEDVKCAVRYLRAHAKQYNLDPNRIGAIGFSAGGHLSMMLGVMGKDDGLEGEGGWKDQSSQVQCVVSYFGPTNLGASDIPVQVQGLVNDFLGSTAEENAEVRKTASPLTYVSQGDAPLLIFQGTKDPLVPHSQALAMIDSLTKHEIPSRIEILVGAQHGWGGKEIIRTANAGFQWFDEHLKGK